MLPTHFQNVQLLVEYFSVLIINSFRKCVFVLFERLNIKQESIPVGCVPPALVVTGGGGRGEVCCLLGMCAAY